ncbi:MAG: DNA repair exonuclease [Gemmatimonadota bacterium]|jgi:DNA repair protein SbcD/Mre11
MIIAHLADLHLGYRAYRRMAPGGVNLREYDVAEAFRVALDRVIELEPDLVLVAGDVFHTVRPSNAAITFAFRQFLRLERALPATPIVVIAGNHDAPRSVESGSILRLLGEIESVTVADAEAGRVELASIDTSVLCVPHPALAAGAEIDFTPSSSGTNIMVLHGTVGGADVEEKLRRFGEYGGVKVDADDLWPERWDYIALGHYHNVAQLTPNMWYAGALERCSTNIWEESTVEKGFLTYDTEAGVVTFHSVPTRRVMDLPRLSARDGDGGWHTPEALDEAIRERVEGVDGGIDDRIVRLVITDITRELFRRLDHRALRQYRARALHFHLDARRPEIHRVAGAGAVGVHRTLEEEVDVFLTSRWKPTAPDIDPKHLVELAQKYLEGTEDVPSLVEGGPGEDRPPAEDGAA